jgi:hypothetical protein
MTVVQTFHIPGLAFVSLNTRDWYEPVLEITLVPDYNGDLREIAKQTRGPDNVYLRCNHLTAVNNPELARFMEVLAHYDYTGDGVPDCDKIMAAIDEALWQTDDMPQEFHRPQGGWYTNLVMSIMSPAPSRHIVFGFGELKPRFRLHHHLFGLVLLGIIFGLIALQDHYLPWMRYSVISGGLALLDSIGLSAVVALIVFIIAFNLLKGHGSRRHAPSLSPHTYGFFNRAAVYEEQAWREGSEHWTMSQRVRSCLSFGAIHMVNLIYPLATILPLAIGGGLFMAVYLRTYRKTQSRRAAVLMSAIWHRVYNRVALTALVIWLIIVFGTTAIALAAAFALTIGCSQLWARRAVRHHQVLVSSPRPVASE